MLKKFTLRLDDRLRETVKRNSAYRGFDNGADYIRFLIEKDSPADGGLFPDHGPIDERLKRLESLLGRLLQELQRFGRDVPIMGKVNMKALAVLLAFFDLEGIPRKGLDQAREFMKRSREELLPEKG
jgi:hypothetical protein